MERIRTKFSQSFHFFVIVQSQSNLKKGNLHKTSKYNCERNSHTRLSKLHLSLIAEK